MNDPSTIQLPAQTFAALLVGSLDDEGKRKLMEAAVTAVLEKRRDSYGPTELERIVEGYVTDKARSAVGDWVAANLNKITTQVDIYLSEHLTELVTQVTTKIFEQVLERSKRGY